ncbi:TonB-dependent receptor [Novosphingobium colocasiae]|uniref:TonB-dependent receptor n=1 Tax=Novosphingobium colocasiae TaxID=1256513 RepID=UPI0035B18393
MTAQKREQSINDVGMTITALGADTLATQGIRSLDDLARSVPGLSFAGTDYGTPVFTLRGVGFYDSSLAGYPTTSVYVDEVPLAFPVLTTHANLDLERVEVLKGPQGTLFGQNSTGGAINFIAAKPTEILAAGVDATVGRFGQGDAGGFVSGPLSDTLKVRLAGKYQFGDGWQRSFTRDDSIGKKSVLSGRLLVDWKPVAGVKIALNLNGWKDRSDPQVGQYFGTFPQTPSDGSAVDPALQTYPFAPSNARAADWGPDHRPRASKSLYQIAMRGDVDIAPDVVLTSISSYVRYKVSQTLDMDGTTIQDFDQFNLGNNKSFTQELRIAGGEGGPLRWVFGGNFERSSTYEEDTYLFDQSTVALVYGLNSSGASAKQKMTNYAVFANGEYDLTPQLTLKLGGRYTEAKRTADICTFDIGNGNALAFFELISGQTIQPGSCLALDFNFNPGLFSDTLKENNFSWRAGADYKISRDLLLYANVAKGYKAGSYPILAATSFASYLPIEQESLLDYEAGFKAKLLGRKLGLNGAVFYYDYRNKQLLTKIIDPVVGTIPALANIPKSRVRGAELELTAAPFEGLQLSGGVTYLDARITRYVGVNAAGVAADFAGTDIPFTPKWQFVMSADYVAPVDGSIRPFFGATLTGRSQAISIVGGDSGATPQPGYRAKVPLGSTFNLPSYTLLDLRAGIEARDGAWRLMVWGKNVTNKYYWQNAITSYDVVTRYAGQPATYGVTFSHRFGG